MAGKARLGRVRAGRRAGGRLGLPGALSVLGLVLVVRTGLVGPHVGRTLSLVDTRTDGGGAGEDDGATAGGELVGFRLEGGGVDAEQRPAQQAWPHRSRARRRRPRGRKRPEDGGGGGGTQAAEAAEDSNVWEGEQGEEDLGIDGLPLEDGVLLSRPTHFKPAADEAGGREVGDAMEENLVTLQEGGAERLALEKMAMTDVKEAQAQAGLYKPAKPRRKQFQGLTNEARVKPHESFTAGYRCKHLGDCAAWKAMTKKIEQRERALEAAKREKKEHHLGISRRWGELIATFTGDPEDYCVKVTDAMEASEVRNAVRECARATLAQEYPWHDLTERALRVQVSVQLGADLEEYKAVVHDEINHLGGHAGLDAARDAFKAARDALEALEKDRLSSGLGPAKVVRTPAQVQQDRARKSWRSRRAHDESFLGSVWTALNATGLQFAATRRAAAGNSSALPLVTSLEIFPTNRFGDRVPFLKDVRQGSIGEVIHEYRFSPEILSLLPDHDMRWAHGTCAVVGNSGSLLKARYGPAIDANEAVVRLNYAPTRGFVEHVGTKTTFDVTSEEISRAMVNGKKIPHRLLNSTMVAYEVTNPTARKFVYPELLKRFAGFSLNKPHVAVLSPQMVAHGHHVYVSLRDVIEGARQEEGKPSKFQRRPMAGYFGVYFALQVCEHVNLYGFSRYTQESAAAKMRYRYFDDAEGQPGRYSFDLAYEIFRQMALWPGSDAYGRITIRR